MLWSELLSEFANLFGRNECDLDDMNKIIAELYKGGIQAEGFYPFVINSFVDQGFDEEDLFGMGKGRALKFLYALIYLDKEVSNEMFLTHLQHFLEEGADKFTSLQLKRTLTIISFLPAWEPNVMSLKS